MNFLLYYFIVKGIMDYVVWQFVYLDFLLKVDIVGEVVCIFCIDSLGIVCSKYIEVIYFLFVKVVEDVIEGMCEWQFVKKVGRDIDSIVVFYIFFNFDIYSDCIWRQQ